MNDNLSQSKNGQQSLPLLTGGEGQHQGTTLQHSNATPTTSTETSVQYAQPPPLDGVAIEGLPSLQIPPPISVQQFGDSAATATTAVADYNDTPENHDAALLTDIPANYEHGGGLLPHSTKLDPHVQDPLQQQHPNDSSSSQQLLDIKGATMPSKTEQQQQMTYNESKLHEKDHSGFVSTASEAVSGPEQNQQEPPQHSPPPNLPPITLPPNPNPLPTNQYPQDNNHPYYHYPPNQSLPGQQVYPHHNQEQAINHPHQVHYQQPPPHPAPIIHHHSPYSPPPNYPYHHQNQHPHFHQQQYQPQQHHPYPSYQHQPPSSGFNTDRPTYLFSLPTTDSQSLSNRQCYIRSTLIELFIATEEDVASRPAKGSQKIHVGQVGMRCAYCVDSHRNSKHKLLVHELQRPRVERAVCFPQSISRIYQTVADMQRRHFEKCTRIPVQVKGTYKSLKSTRPRGKGNPQEYWESSARKIGLVDSGVEGRGIRVMEDDQGGMVEQFLLQRKKEHLPHWSNEESRAAGQSDRDINKKPSAKRRRSNGNAEEGNRTKDSSSKKRQTNVGQGKKPSVVAENNVDEPPPISSYSDAHLLASMRDRASPPLPVGRHEEV
jgi:Mn-containing catalase